MMTRKQKHVPRFTKLYRMAGNGFSLWFSTYKDANDCAKRMYKNSGEPWYGRANKFYIDLETGELK